MRIGLIPLAVALPVTLAVGSWALHETPPNGQNEGWFPDGYSMAEPGGQDTDSTSTDDADPVGGGSDDTVVDQGKPTTGETGDPSRRRPPVTVPSATPTHAPVPKQSTRPDPEPSASHPDPEPTDARTSAPGPGPDPEPKPSAPEPDPEPTTAPEPKPTSSPDPSPSPEPTTDPGIPLPPLPLPLPLPTSLPLPLDQQVDTLDGSSGRSLDGAVAGVVGDNVAVTDPTFVSFEYFFRTLGR